MSTAVLQVGIVLSVVGTAGPSLIGIHQVGILSFLEWVWPLVNCSSLVSFFSLSGELGLSRLLLIMELPDVQRLSRLLLTMKLADVQGASFFVSVSDQRVGTLRLQINDAAVF